MLRHINSFDCALRRINVLKEDHGHWWCDAKKWFCDFAKFVVNRINGSSRRSVTYGDHAALPWKARGRTRLSFGELIMVSSEEKQETYYGRYAIGFDHKSGPLFIVHDDMLIFLKKELV